jgi:hypothetical protein
MLAMPRRLRAIAVAVPLVALGSLSAHGLGYFLAERDPERRAELLSTTGHAYLADVWLALLAALAVCLALELVLGFVQGPPVGAVPAWPFALLAPVGFLAQEHFERGLGTAGGAAALADRAVLLGLVLQAPFALVTWWLARVVLRCSTRLKPAAPPTPLATPGRRALAPLPVETDARPRRNPLGLRVGGRGPPALPST